jgi:hypothetical protein
MGERKNAAGSGKKRARPRNLWVNYDDFGVTSVVLNLQEKNTGSDACRLTHRGVRSWSG